MAFDVKRVTEARYPGRVREAALNQEREDDKERLAELEDFVRRHRKAPPPREDSVELKSPTPSPGEAPPPEPPSKPASEKPKADDGKHLDIRI